MKLDSKYFDSVRVTPDLKRRQARPEAPACQWKGCQSPGPTARRRGAAARDSIHLLCLDHVREFNASYNYFDGMSNAEVEAYQKDSVYRPPADLEGRRQRLGARHPARRGSQTADGPRARQRPASVLRLAPAVAARRAPTPAAAEAAGTKVARSARSWRRRPTE